MATYGVAVSRTEYIQGQCYSSWPCGRISATILCVVACGVITFRCAEASLKRQHLHATWKRRASETHARTHACTHARTRVVHAHVSNVESIKKKEGESEREREGKKKARGCHVSRIEGDNGFLFHPCGASSCLSGLWLHEWIVVLRLHCARFPVLRCGNCCPPWHLHRPIPHHFSGLFSLASFFPPSPESDAFIRHRWLWTISMKPWIPWYLFYNSFELFSFSLSFIGSMERKLLDYRFDDTNKVYSMLSSSSRVFRRNDGT